MSGLRDDLARLGDEAFDYLDADKAVRSADRRRRVRRLAGGPALAAAALALAVGAYTLLDGVGPGGGDAAVPPQQVLGVDLFDTRAGVIRTEDGRTVPLPGGYDWANAQYIDAAAVPSGWIVFANGDMMLLLPDGTTAPIGSGRWPQYAISPDGGRIAWLSGNDEIRTAVLTGGQVVEGGTFRADRDKLLPVGWRGSEVVITADGDQWTSWNPDAPTDPVWATGEAMGVTPTGAVLTDTASYDTKQRCLALWEGGPGAPRRTANWCWNYQQESQWTAMRLSPNGRWLNVSDTFVVDLTDQAQALPDAQWSGLQPCGAKPQQFWSWLDGDGLLLEREVEGSASSQGTDGSSGPQRRDWVRCDLPSQESAAVAQEDMPGGSIVTRYGD